MGLNYLSIPKLQRLQHWSLVMIRYCLILDRAITGPYRCFLRYPVRETHREYQQGTDAGNDQLTLLKVLTTSISVKKSRCMKMAATPNFSSQKNLLLVRTKRHIPMVYLLLYRNQTKSQHGWVITRPVKCGIKLLIHYQTSTVQPLKFENW